MFQPVKFFENYFESDRINNHRLHAFAEDALNNLKARNSNGDFTAIIARLEPVQTAFTAEMGTLDVALTRQKGKTMVLDGLVSDFRQTMSEMEGVIARAVGGMSSASYLEFYPQGVDEYRRGTKSKIPELTNRVKAAATKHALALGEELTTKLQGFTEGWQQLRSVQEQQKGKVSTSRTNRTEARANLEMALMETIHFIGNKFPGNPDKCMSFFSFQKLQKHSVKEADKD